MLKILIIENDIIQVKQVLNYMNNINISFKIYGIAYNINEILDILQAESFDLILLDADMSSNSYNKFFNYIKNNNSIKYKKAIILFHSTNNIFNKKDNYYIYSYIIKPFTQETFTKNILQFFNKNNKKSIIDMIKFELETLNFKSSYIGTKYLIDCIYQVYLMGNRYSFHLFTEVLPIISKKYRKSIDCIYGSIKNAINNMYFDCKEDIFKEYFNIYEPSKPKPKDLICKVLDNINN